MENTKQQNKEESVKELLEEIRDNTATPWWRPILNGVFTGSGWVLGTVLTIAALGWILSIFGVIPGFAEITAQLQTIISTKL